MYTFFINDRPFILCSPGNIPARYSMLPQVSYENSGGLMQWVRKAEEVNSSGLLLLCADPAGVLEELKKQFTAIHAGGGIVFNRHGQLLLMKRLGKWDLPKGKIDPGETAEEGALREVEEECGIDKLYIKRFYTNSYHTYKLQGHRFLKITHWYLMQTDFEGVLTPQAEENITEVKWEDFEALNPAELDTYASIRELLTDLKENKL